jgi:hypothetical protein
MSARRVWTEAVTVALVADAGAVGLGWLPPSPQTVVGAVIGGGLFAASRLRWRAWSRWRVVCEPSPKGTTICLRRRWTQVPVYRIARDRSKGTRSDEPYEEVFAERFVDAKSQADDLNRRVG